MIGAGFTIKGHEQLAEHVKSGQAGAADGEATGVAVTTDNTATRLCSLFTSYPGASVGTGITFDIGAQSNAGVNFGFWQAGRATWDKTGALVASSKGATSGSNAGALPAGWDISFGAGPVLESAVSIIADGSVNNVKAKIKYRVLSPST